MKVTRLWGGLGAALLCGVVVSAQEPNWDEAQFVTTDLGNGIYMLHGMGGNIGLSVGEDGVFLIDDDFAPMSEKLIAAIGEITDQHVDFLLNTHWHADHIGGNESFAQGGTVVFAHHNVRSRMAMEGPLQASDAALPVMTFSEAVTFHFNGQEIAVTHPVRAHTDGDAIVHFVEADLIHAGDVLFSGMYPRIDIDAGGSVDGFIAALEGLAAMAGPDTTIIPGHGPVAAREDVLASLTMLKTARSRVQALIDQGMSKDEVIDANPLAELNPEWEWFFINGDRMTESLYLGLTERQ